MEEGFFLGGILKETDHGEAREVRRALVTQKGGKVPVDSDELPVEGDLEDARRHVIDEVSQLFLIGGTFFELWGERLANGERAHVN